MNNHSPKLTKRKLRELAAISYENEMEAHLQELLKSFDRWKKGKLNVFQLDEIIHKYHDIKARESYNAYNGLDHKMFIVRAVSKGILQEADIPEDIRDSIMQLVEILKE